MKEKLVFKKCSPSNVRTGIKIGKRLPRERRAVEFNMVAKFRGAEYVIRGREMFEIIGGKLAPVGDREKALFSLRNARWKQKPSIDKLKVVGKGKA